MKYSLKKAYVQRVNGKYVNDATFSYVIGLQCLKIPIEFFDEDKSYSLELGRDAIVVTGVPTTIKAFKQMGIAPPAPLDIPPDLNKYCDRWIVKSTIRKAIESDLKFSLFVKPAEHGKLFSGQVVSYKEELDLFKYCDTQLGENIPIILSEPVKFISEYRSFVLDGKILDCRKYRGDYNVVPDFQIIKNAVNDYVNSPIAYAIDFGVTDDGKTLLVECNEAYSLGPYGFDSIEHTNMFIRRWFELIGDKLILTNV